MAPAWTGDPFAAIDSTESHEMHVVRCLSRLLRDVGFVSTRASCGQNSRPGVLAVTKDQNERSFPFSYTVSYKCAGGAFGDDVFAFFIWVPTFCSLGRPSECLESWE